MSYGDEDEQVQSPRAQIALTQLQAQGQGGRGRGPGAREGSWGQRGAKQQPPSLHLDVQGAAKMENVQPVTWGLANINNASHDALHSVSMLYTCDKRD